jgi:ATP-binding cassette, subfamily C (CFTR/MRP), member 1
MARFCPSDASFGPTLPSNCRSGFDFTLTFEDSILALVPQLTLLLLAPIRLSTLTRRRSRVRRNSHLGFLKELTSSSYAASSIALLALWAVTPSQIKSHVSVIAAAFEMLAAFVLALLSRYEHERAVRPSSLLQLFLLVILVCDAVRLRTLYLMGYNSALLVVSSIHTFLIGALLLLESLDKRELFQAKKDRERPDEETTGLFARRLLWYLNSLFRRGYRKVLRPADLCGIDSDLTSKKIAAAFEKHWDDYQRRGVRGPIFRVIWKVLWKDILYPIPPRLLYMGTLLSQPFLIKEMVKYIQTTDHHNSLNIGYGLIGAFALNYSLLAIFLGWFSQANARFIAKLRYGLISLLYRQMLFVNIKDVNLTSATVLMNVDTEKVILAVQFWHDFWAMAVAVAIAAYILYSTIGVAFLAPLVVIGAATALSSWVGKRSRPRQLEWMRGTEKRVSAIAHATSYMKGIRMLGLTESILSNLTKLREQEVELSK